MLKIKTTPFDDQHPGTSGLRKKTKVFMQQHYLENFIQSALDVLKEQKNLKEEALIVGGDGRFFNREAVKVIVRLCVANGLKRVLVGRWGIFSTPAVSATIRARSALGGFILSASHNPGGRDHDFGVKYNGENGGPAPKSITEKIFERSKTIEHYDIADDFELDFDHLSSKQVGETTIEIVDPMEDYMNLMERIFDLDRIRALFEGGFTLTFDAMNAVTGPYAKQLFEECLGAAEGTVIRGIPKEDFGGIHPDPNLVYAKELVEKMNGKDASDLGAASDGDGDRNMILGKNFFVSPGDSLALIAEHLEACAPGYQDGLKGVARSMPTSRAVDRVANEKKIACYETPTGWKYFGNLMDAELCTLCGEESFGTSSSHVREKDGLWAVLCWLSILAFTGKSVQELMEEHWKKYGRDYFQRYDYDKLPIETAREMLSQLREQLSSLKGKPLGGSEIQSADDFLYEDPVDHSVSEHQGIRIYLQNGARVVMRLSGTGTEGAMLRLYFEKYEKTKWNLDLDSLIKPLADSTAELLQLKRRFNRDEADIVT